MMETDNDMQVIMAAILRLEDQRAALGLKKREIETELQAFTKKIRVGGRKVNQNYASLSKRQQRLREELLEIDTQLAPIKSELRQWYSRRDDHRANTLISIEQTMESAINASSSVLSRGIKQLRDKYLDFAEDQTRVNSMRVMAAQFANELTSILSQNPESD